MSDEKEPHGNSKKSEKEQHLYEIIDNQTNETVKYGISGSELNKDGSSKRANSQVNYLNKIFGALRYFAKILFTNIKGREKSLDKEKDLVNKYAQNKNGENPPLQKIPKAEI